MKNMPTPHGLTKRFYNNLPIMQTPYLYLYKKSGVPKHAAYSPPPLPQRRDSFLHGRSLPPVLEEICRFVWLKHSAGPHFDHHRVEAGGEKELHLLLAEPFDRLWERVGEETEASRHLRTSFAQGPNCRKRCRRQRDDILNEKHIPAPHFHALDELGSSVSLLHAANVSEGHTALLGGHGCWRYSTCRHTHEYHPPPTFGPRNIDQFLKRDLSPPRVGPQLAAIHVKGREDPRLEDFPACHVEKRLHHSDTTSAEQRPYNHVFAHVATPMYCTSARYSSGV